MENIVNQLFWLWAPLTLIPEWLRIGIVIFLIIVWARPVIFFVVPKIAIGTSFLLIKLLRIISFPVMWITNKYEEKDAESPLWIEIIFVFFSSLEKGLQSINQLAKRKLTNIGVIKRWTRRIAFLTAVLLSLAITNGPTEIYAVKWKEFDTFMTQEKLQNELGFNAAEFVASFESEAEELDGSETRLTLNDSYKNGGNIRSEPSLNAKQVDDLVWEEVVTYLDEEAVDAEGRKWLKVTTQEGVVGWVSAKILREY